MAGRSSLPLCQVCLCCLQHGPHDETGKQRETGMARAGESEVAWAVGDWGLGWIDRPIPEAATGRRCGAVPRRVAGGPGHQTIERWVPRGGGDGLILPLILSGQVRLCVTHMSLRRGTVRCVVFFFGFGAFQRDCVFCPGLRFWDTSRRPPVFL